MMKLSSNRQGFTLIEVLTAIGIFSIGFLAVAAMQTSSLSQTTSSRVQTEAVEVASSHLEFLYQLPFYPAFDEVHADDCDRFGMDADYPLAARPPNNPHDETVNFTDRAYLIEWVVTDLDADDHTLESIYCPGQREVLYKSIVITVADAARPGRVLAEKQFLKVCDYEI